ncbi:helix-turn-helix domain-containing protein [Enterococcus xiangfangensis]|uniref:helix-turn-helix domain-containing protein n=1 Tax=Enterococcus xiangfangensis TaxID=1296537 RepID=UPI003D169D90|nr:DNA-binding protein [Enterococcus asini]
MAFEIDTSDLVEELKEAVKEAVATMPNAQSPKDYLTTSEIREYAGGISTGTLTKWRKAGLKCIVIDGLNFYKREDVIEFMDAHRCA